MSEDAADIVQGGTAPKHLRGREVAKNVKTLSWGGYASTANGSPDNVGHARAWQGTKWRDRAEKNKIIRD